MDRIEYSGVLSKDLFLKVQRLHAGRRWLLLWLFPVAMTALVLLDGARLPWYVLAAIAFSVSSLFPIAMGLLHSYFLRRLYDRSTLLREPFHGAVTKTDFEFVTSSVVGKFAWQKFIELKDFDSIVLLYQAPNVFNLVAREFFASDEMWQRAKELMRAQFK